jgi:hypothetical protein
VEYGARQDQFSVFRAISVNTRLPTSTSRWLTEILLVLGGLAALTGLELLATRSTGLISHPMWLDESVSNLLLKDPSFRHMAAAIHGGVDTNGPAFYLVTWPFVHAFGATTVSEMRLLTAGMMLVALAGIYATCRAFVDPGRAAIATLVVAAHPGVVVQMWQMRMYGFWLGAVAWFCVYTVLAPPRASWVTRLVGCALGILVVTSHWLGVFALVLISVPALFLTWSESDRRVNHALPLAAGLGGLLLCLPLIASQRRILTVPTWIEPASIASILRQGHLIFLVPSAGVVAGYALLRVAQPSRWRPAVIGLPARTLPILALLLFPLALLAMSVAMQSVLVERYMLPTTVGLALVAAVVALPFQRWVGLSLGAVAACTLVLVSCLELNALRAAVQGDDARAARVIAITERVIASGRHLVFARRFEAYPLIQARPRLADSVAVFDFEGTGEGVMRRTLFERDLGRAVSRFYPDYHLVSEDQLRRWGRFVVITDSAEEDELRRLLPGFQITAHGIDEYEVQAR